MEIITNNAESAFHSILDSIGKNPENWKSWHCLHLETPELEDFRDNPDMMAFAEAMMDCYLEEYDGKVYFCGSHDLYIMTSSIGDETLLEIGDEICASLFFKHSGEVHKRIYNLMSESLEFVYTLCGQGRIFKVNATPTEIPQDQKQNTTPPRVLLVEDDASTRWIVRTALKDICDLSTAQDVHSAMEKLSSNKPDLVFLDINLPDGSGLSILEWLAKEQPTTRVVMFSSHNTMDNMSHALCSGALGFVSKPFAKSRLIEYVRECSPSH